MRAQQCRQPTWGLTKEGRHTGWQTKQWQCVILNKECSHTEANCSCRTLADSHREPVDRSCWGNKTHTQSRAGKLQLVPKTSIRILSCFVCREDDGIMKLAVVAHFNWKWQKHNLQYWFVLICSFRNLFNPGCLLCVCGGSFCIFYCGKKNTNLHSWAPFFSTARVE